MMLEHVLFLIPTKKTDLTNRVFEKIIRSYSFLLSVTNIYVYII